MKYIILWKLLLESYFYDESESEMRECIYLFIYHILTLNYQIFAKLFD